MNDFKFSGMGVALVTPFTVQNTIDFSALGTLVDNQINSGADFIVVLGTTAETPALSPVERAEVAQFVLDRTAGRVPLVLGVGGNSTQAVIDELHSGIANGFSAILSVVPYYNKPGQQGIYHHFIAVADASPVPVILYNVPSRTGVNMLPETTLRLAAHPNIRAIKEASGIVGQSDRIMAKAPEGFNLLSGDDALTLPLMSMGAKGIISVIGNAFPGEFSRLVHLCAEGNFTDALALHRRFNPLYPLMFSEGNPAGVKCLLSVLGFCENKVRLPLTEVSADTAEKIRLAAQPLIQKK